MFVCVGACLTTTSCDWSLLVRAVNCVEFKPHTAVDTSACTHTRHSVRHGGVCVV